MQKVSSTEKQNQAWKTVAGMSLLYAFLDIHQKNRHGMLYLSRGELRSTVIFKSGAPVFVNTGSPNDSLANLLTSRNVVSRKDLKAAYAEAKQSGNRLGSVLVEKGLVTQNDLMIHIREHIRVSLLKVLDWKDGFFLFEEQPPKQTEAYNMDLGPPELPLLLLDAIEKNFSLDETGNHPDVPLDVDFRLNDAIKLPANQAALTKLSIHQLIPLIDGKSNLAGLLEKSKLQRLEIVRALFALKQFGFVTTSNHDEALALGPVILKPEDSEAIDPDALGLDQSDPVTLQSAESDSLASTPTGQLKNSKESSAPVILGDLGSLEKQYQAKKDAGPPKEPEPEPPQKPQLKPPATPAAAPETNDAPGETTLDPEKIQKHLRGKKEKSQPPPTPPPAPTVPKPSEVKKPVSIVPISQKYSDVDPALKRREEPAPPPRRPTVNRSEEKAVVELSSTKNRTWMVLRGAVLGALLIFGAIFGFVYLDPMQAAQVIERMRFQKMYGKPVLDPKRRAQFYVDDGQLKQAKASFLLALQTNPKDEGILLSLAGIHLQFSEIEEAKKLYERVLEISPNDGEAHLGLAWCFLKQGDAPSAKREFYLYLAKSSISPQSEAVRKIVEHLQ